MELSELEQLALGVDRAAALATLLPGTTEHDYWRGVLLQHEGRLEEVDAILRSWGERHRGHDDFYTRLARRQLLAKARVDVGAMAEDILRETYTTLDDRAEVVVQAQRFPTRLDPALLDDRNVLREAVRRRANLEDVNDAAIPDIVRDHSLIPGFSLVRRTLLQRLQRADIPGALELVIADLADKDGSNGTFGALPIHAVLTLAQLETIGLQLPAVRAQSAWVDAVLVRLAPPSWVDLRIDREERARVIDRAYAFAQTLAPAFNTLKATLLYQRLVLDRAAGTFDRARFRAYIELPRQAPWVSRERLRTYSNDRLVQPTAQPASSLGLEAIGDDESLLRDYLSRFLLEEDESAFSDLLDRDWLANVMAKARLLAGATGSEAERCTKLLSAAEREALRDRVDIELAPQNPPFFGANDDVTLEVDVKNVRELEVKVFRIDALAYWLAKNREVDTSIDLDGMIPSGQERKLSFDTAPIRRQRVRIDLPECKRPGTYVVELIGNGRSSRALLRKGSLRHLTRVTAAGTIVTVTDEDGHPLPAARLWLGGRELAPRDPVAGGGISVPFATGPAVAMLLVHGDVVQSAFIERPVEHAILSAGFHVDRESLVATQSARVLCRPRLTLGGAPVSIAMLENARVDINVTDLAGTASSRTQPIVLHDDADVAIDVQIPDGTIELSLYLRGRVRIASRQETVDVADGCSSPLNLVHRSELTAMLHLARVAAPEGDSYVLSFLGKTGEPLAGRAIAISLQHRCVGTPLQGTLETDANGAIALGALDGKVLRVSATLPSGAQRSWDISRANDRPPGTVHALEGETITLPRTADTRSVHDLSLMEIRRGANAKDVSARLAVVDRHIAIDGLPAGDYRLDYPARASTVLTVAPRAAGIRAATHPSAAAGRWVHAGDVLLELPEPAPLVRRLAVDGDAVVLHVSGTTPATRVHVVATRFIPDQALPPSPSDLRRGMRTPTTARLFRNVAQYVSGRDIGDEYRYVLERRRAPRRPGTMLEKPSLLLHPWALRATTTSRAEAAPGQAYRAAPPPHAAGAPMPAAGSARRDRLMAKEAAGEEPGAPSVDFLAQSAVVLANLRVDADGVVRIPRADLGPDAQSVQIFVVDPSLGAPLSAEVTLPATPLRARDLRLRLALDPERHFAEQRRIDGVPADTILVVPDVRTGKIELVDTLARAHQLLVTLTGDASDLRDFAFVTEWPSLDDATRRARYSKYACHELNLFLWKKDRPFFDAVIRPSLAHKREKSVVDRFLLGEDLTPFLEAWAFGRLNTVERILVALAVPPLRASLARLVGDRVDLAVPDPERDAQLVATLLGSAALEADAGAMAGAAAAAAPAEMLLSLEEAAPNTSAAKYKKGAKMAKSENVTRAGSISGGGGLDAFMADQAERNDAGPLYRGAEKTQEWAEVQWWKRRISEIDASLIAPNRFWRDLAAHAAGPDAPPFLSPHIGDCANGFADAMCALTFLDLPFVAAVHTTTLEDTRFTITPRSNALAASSSLVEVASRADSLPPSSVLVGQSYVRSDDRWEWEDGEQREKRITGEMIAGVVYRCLVVVTNPTSASEKLDVLMQIPKGAMPVDSGFITRTFTVRLPPYGTQSLDYAFYFPVAGRFTHFPAHVTRAGELLVAATARELDVVAEPSELDAESWSHVSQHGSLADVLAFLDRANLGRIDLARIAWRMHDNEAFTTVIALLSARHVYDDHLWGYALRHRDAQRAAEWLRHRDDFLQQGGIMLDGVVDPIARGWYQHLEYAPLINARAHRLGAQRRILNSALDTQYRLFLDVTAHRAKVSGDDLLVAAHYLLCMDRVEDAMALLERVQNDQIGARVQFDYLSAYVACYRGDLATARRLTTPWLDHPVDRWRNRFLALAQMLDEVGTTEKPSAIDADSRDQRMAEAAAHQPSLDIVVHGNDIELTHANLAECQVRFFKMDIELVFSRQPFVQSDVDRFSFIEPGLVLDVPLGGTTTVVAIPPSLRGANLVIEAVAPGLRRSVAHYAHDLGVQVAHAFGQLKVVRASTGAPLSAVYVKVYARERAGRIAFFKDGYTDLRGRLDYATLSTDDLDRVDRFAILVASDDAGATITEAAPPTR